MRSVAQAIAILGVFHIGCCALADPPGVYRLPDVRDDAPADTGSVDIEASENLEHDEQIVPARFLRQPQPIMLPEGGQLPLDNGLDFSFRNERDGERFGIGTDFYSAPEFEGGILVFGPDVAMKIGGFVNANLIYDFDPIDSKDSFNTVTIPTSGPHRTNTRYQARQTRLSFDTRWRATDQIVQMYVEGDFFTDNGAFRLRHAYGEVGQVLVGQTWTTFTDVAAAPATLDFEGSVSSVNRRQAQIRWTIPVVDDTVMAAVALENPRNIIENDDLVEGESRTPSPDFVIRLRYDQEYVQLQVAGVYRDLGFQVTDMPVITTDAWGMNFTGVVKLIENNKVYYQILFGEGIGSYRDLPDAALTLVTADVIGMFGWMVGLTHEWTEQVSSNFTYAENHLDTVPGQPTDDVERTTYLAANLIWSPYERVGVGIEYLHGLREDISGAVGKANRVQFGVVYFLP